MSNPMTVAQMIEQVTLHFVNSLGSDSDRAKARAFIAVGRLLEEDYLEWWGMTEDHQPLYVPAAPVKQVLVYRIEEL